MHMVGYQYIRLQRALRLAQPVQVAGIVLFAKEARLAIVAALDNVQRYTVKLDAGTSWHVGKIA